MYTRDLKENLRLRLSGDDMDFLRWLSDKRGITISECIRGIIGEYRRSMETVDLLSRAMKLAEEEKGRAVHGDTKTDFDDKL